MSTGPRRGKPRTNRHRRSSLGERFADWALPIGAAMVAAVTPFLLEVLPDDPKRWLAAPLFYVCVLLGVGAVLLVAVQIVTSTRMRGRERGGITKLSHSLTDTFRTLHKLVDSERSISDKRDFFDAVLRDVPKLIHLETPRACVYELDADDQHQSMGYFLRLQAHGGRGDHPRPEFRADTDHGRAIIEVALSNKHRCVDDPNKAPFDVDRPEASAWESFLAIPLRQGKESWGVLMVDTTKKTTFTEDHIAVALAVARLIEIGLSGVREAAEDTGPEIRGIQEEIARLEDDNGGNHG